MSTVGVVSEAKSAEERLTKPAIAHAPLLAGSRPAGRMIQIDVLRGVAILLVIGAHEVVDSHKAGFLSRPATPWQQGGWSGVALFFVLSGFLVGGLLFKELLTRRSLDIPRFMIRRALKIWRALSTAAKSRSSASGNSIRNAQAMGIP